MKSKSGFGLPKSHRLNSKLLIQELFDASTSVKQFPLFVQYYWSDTIENNLFMPMVSKRKFKRAVDRNRIKRQMREVWRLNQHLINGLNKGFLVIGVAYIATTKLKYSEIEKSFLASIEKLNELD